MNKLLTTTALVLTMAFSGMAYADNDWKGDGHHHGPIQEALSKLPEKDAAQFRDTMKQARESDKASFEQMHKLHDELYAITTADKFDKAAFIAKNKELHALHNKMHEHMTEAMATALSQLPPDERKTFADAIKEMHHGHHHEHDGDKAPTAKDSK